jgi:hypothetical protein
MSKERSRVLPNLPTTLELGTDVQTYAWIDCRPMPGSIFLPKRATGAALRSSRRSTMRLPRPR